MYESFVIRVENLKKNFVLHGEETALTRLAIWAKGTGLPRKLVALNKISFSVSKGEVLGIIGRNGSGKSTLLRILAGIYSPTNGTVIVKGKVIPIINLQVGLHQKLTMKDNIYLTCALFGLTSEEVSIKFDDIVAFTELNDFVNTQIYQFSSGMIARLAFSIVAHLEPEILILDEVFMAGDAYFKEKSMEKMLELVKGDATVVIASHQSDLIEHVVDKVIWLEKGEMKMYGSPDKVIKCYNDFFKTRRKRFIEMRKKITSSIKK